MSEVLSAKKDVIVVGGGMTGLVAAISAARNGAQTLLVERYGFLGGMATAANVEPITGTHFGDQQLSKGVWQEIVDRLKEVGGTTGPIIWKHRKSYIGKAFSTSTSQTFFDREKLKYIAMEMALESGVELLLHTWAVDVLVEDNRVRGVVLQTKSGRRIIMADIVVDTTGDGDIAAAAGAEYKSGRDEDALVQPMTLMLEVGNVNTEKFERFVEENLDLVVSYTVPTNPPELSGKEYTEHYFSVMGFFDLVRQAKEKGELTIGTDAVNLETTMWKGVWFFNCTRIQRVDGTKSEDLTRAEVEGRRQAMSVVNFAKKYLPGFESCYLLSTGSQVGVRETRRIIGEYLLTSDDVLNGAKFEDRIGYGVFPVDVHPVKGSDWYTSKEGHWIELKEPYDIPYRCLVPRKVDNILVAGRCISTADQIAQGSIRVMGTCMVTGQAAGTAAAIAVKSKTTPRKINISVLQQKLREQGACLR